jgi:hypothetical protein
VGEPLLIGLLAFEDYDAAIMISHAQVLARVVEGQCGYPVLLRGESRFGVAQTLHELERPLIHWRHVFLPTFGLRPLACISFFIVLV